MRLMYRISATVHLALAASLALLGITSCSRRNDQAGAKSLLRWSVGEARAYRVPENGSVPPLFQVRTALKLETGDVVAANASSNQLIFFTPSGIVRNAVGGSGGGPDEFSALGTIWPMPGDSIGAWDGLGQRITVWTNAGQAAREIQVNLDFLPRALHLWNDTTYIAIQAGPRRRTQPNTTFVDSVALIQLNSAGSSVRELRRVPYDHIYASERPGGTTGYTGFPLLPRGHVAAGNGSLYVGYSDSWKIMRLEEVSSVVDTIHLQLARRAFTAEDRSQWVDTLLARATSTRPMSRRFLDELPYPDSLPTYDSMIIDEQGNLWLREYYLEGDPDPRWYVVNGQGELTATVTLPGRYRPTQIGQDFITGIETDSLGMESVVVRPLIR